LVKVKICGLTRIRDVQAAVEAEVDSLGFVVGTPTSPRNLSTRRAQKLLSVVPGDVIKLAVTVFHSLKALREIDSCLQVDSLQLHGDVERILSYAPEIHSLGLNCVVAVNGRSPRALDFSLKCSQMFGSVLHDTAGPGGLGGTGVAHEWVISRRVRDVIAPSPLTLAGGLTPENVADAVRMVEPSGVDVSSGVEEKPGVKDVEKMRRFIAEAKEAGP